MHSFQMSVPDEMWEALQTELKLRKLGGTQELIRSILSEHFKNSGKG
jgi:hypothetical protein